MSVVAEALPRPTLLSILRIRNFALSPFHILLPIFTKTALGQGSEGFGLLMSGLGAGMVVGSLAVGVWSPRARRGIFTFVGTMLAGILFAALGLLPIFAVTLAILIAVGVLIAIVNTVLAATMQGIIADEYRGRVFSLDMTISAALVPVALALAGGLADAIGAGMVFVAGGALTALTSLVGLLFREIRALQ